MKLDKETDRRLLLALIAQAQFTGEILEEAADLKSRIKVAELEVAEPAPESESV